MIEQLRNCDARESAIRVARTLDLNLKEPEKLRHQKDASVVLEVTLSKPQMEALRRAKDVASHVLPKASWAEVISFLTEDYLKRKDLSREHVTSRPASLQRRASGVAVAKITASSQSQGVNPQEEIRLGHETASVTRPGKPARTALPTKMKRIVMNRDQTCQHVDRDTGEVCQSTYQLQFDHVLSVSKGGRDDVANLQILCGAHNRLKYRRFG